MSTKKFKFAELSETAKKVAVYNYLDLMDREFTSSRQFTLDDARSCCEDHDDDNCEIFYLENGEDFPEEESNVT